MLQNSILSPILINDAAVDIIEINYVSTGRESYCAPHVHTWFEMNYTTENSMVTGVGPDVFRVNENELLLIPPGIEHYHTYDPLKPYACFVLQWILRENDSLPKSEGNGFLDFLNKLSNAKPHAMKDIYGISDLFEKALKEAENPYNPVSLQLIMVKIITVMAGLCSGQSAMMYKKDVGLSSLVRKVEMLLNDSSLKELTVDTIARSLHMSYGHLARTYKKQTGNTILERLNQIRIEKSKEYLLNTDYSIKELSFKAGFESQFYFSRLFRLKTGMTPSEFRHQRPAAD